LPPSPPRAGFFGRALRALPPAQSPTVATGIAAGSALGVAAVAPAGYAAQSLRVAPSPTTPEAAMTTRSLAVPLGLLLALPVASTDARQQEKKPGRLTMSRAVPCKKIDGFRKYQPLREVALTRDEKLLVYYEPRNFASEEVEGGYQAHLVQDGQIRRKDQKKVLRREEKAIDLKPKAAEGPPANLYIYTNVSLKGLEPGEYELDIILHDEVRKGTTATQTVPFRIVAAKDKKAEKDAEPADEDDSAKDADDTPRP
jgi:hypothetical protein